ncbi:hypothetical protein MPTK1_2g03510 [Marchantia polymorpha subsp. ruderalis]|uniref:Uncharacterized protein n=1 Tax=Marchantia polymorpha TaxID=3197 RepID=A0A2R6X7D1_MARPO|nr:hypothetical protein MARPO_0031s0007 [Marchantia polymorpha]PTQ42016.1 hypothetical protein MARPO_0031s0007 [Marchantia polymorpha]BBN00967.1 hypothetical protein Mp_2g03510 [Marchantia polymorpha subsp. ruderalis]BBN00968.1 hypothetical protein Mp_2g03510 [Marchantia polymorpha subsp. ruderalis]|eukprot:PTQ42015.1 hypothetical protein MARPO_0031s0007 [Marchantia polymorpha]
MVLKDSSKKNLGGHLYMKTRQFLKGLKTNKRSASRNLPDAEFSSTSTEFMKIDEGEPGYYPEISSCADVGNTSFRHWVDNSDSNLSHGEDGMETSDIVPIDDMTSQPQSYESQDWLPTFESRHYQLAGATCIDNDQSLVAQESAEESVDYDASAINIPYLDCRRPSQMDGYRITVTKEVKEERIFWFWKRFSFMDAISAWRNG